MKSHLIFSLYLLIIGLVVVWLFFPSHAPYLSNIWGLIGEPGFLGRLGYFAAFCFLVFLLSVRLLKD